MSSDPSERINAIRLAIEALFTHDNLRSNGDFTQRLCPRMMIAANQLLAIPEVQDLTSDISDVLVACRLSKDLHREEATNGGWQIGILPYASLRSRCSVVVACPGCPDFTLSDITPLLTEPIFFHAFNPNPEPSTGGAQTLSGGGATGPLHLTFVDDKAAKRALLDLQKTNVRGHPVISRLRIFSIPPATLLAERAAEAALHVKGMHGAEYREGMARSGRPPPRAAAAATPAATGVAVAPSPLLATALAQQQQQQQMLLQASTGFGMLPTPLGLGSPMGLGNPGMMMMMMRNLMAMQGTLPRAMLPTPFAAPVSDSSFAHPLGGAAKVAPSVRVNVGFKPNPAAAAFIPPPPEAVTVTEAELDHHQPRYFRNDPYSRSASTVNVSPKRVLSMGVAPIDWSAAAQPQPLTSMPHHGAPSGAPSNGFQRPAGPSHGKIIPDMCEWQQQKMKTVRPKQPQQQQQPQAPPRSASPPLPRDMDFPLLPGVVAPVHQSSTPSSDGESSAVVNSNSGSDTRHSGASSSWSAAGSPTFAQVAAQMRVK